MLLTSNLFFTSSLCFSFFFLEPPYLAALYVEILFLHACMHHNYSTFTLPNSEGRSLTTPLKVDVISKLTASLWLVRTSLRATCQAAINNEWQSHSDARAQHGHNITENWGLMHWSVEEAISRSQYRQRQTRERRGWERRPPHILKVQIATLRSAIFEDYCSINPSIQCDWQLAPIINRHNWTGGAQLLGHVPQFGYATVRT